MPGKHSRHRIEVKRWLLTALALFALTFSAVGLVVRAQAVDNMPRLVLSVGATFVPLVALAGLAFAVFAHRRGLAILGILFVTATAVIQVKWYYMGKPTEIGPYTEIRLLSSNLRKGRADAANFVQLAKSNADLVTVAELTADAVQRFADAGINNAFPHSMLDPASGVGIWSRYPLTAVSAPRHRNVAIPAARLEIPSLEFEPLVASVHVMSPVAGDENTLDEWRYGMAAAKAQLDNFAKAAGPGAVIIGGDYNSTPDMRQFRDLLANGYHDSVEQLGAGFAPTFKADGVFPPLITIDHILVRNAATASIRTIQLSGSDHRSLLASIRLPLSPSTG